MGWRLVDLSIRARLYALVGIGIGGMALLLALATYAIAEFRINGQRHEPIKFLRMARAEVSPPTIYLSELYLALQELETARDARTIEEGKRVVAKHVERFRSRRDEALAHLPPGPLLERIKGEVSGTAQALVEKAEGSYLPLLGKGKQEDVTAALGAVARLFQGASAGGPGRRPRPRRRDRPVGDEGGDRPGVLPVVAVRGMRGEHPRRRGAGAGHHARHHRSRWGSSTPVSRGWPAARPT